MATPGIPPQSGPAPAAGSAPRFAFFDLDGTLLPWDTQLLFCNHVLRRRGWRRILLVPFLLLTPLAALHVLRSRAMKRVFLAYLWRIRRDDLAALAEEFADEVADRHLWPEMRAEVERHRAEGCVLVLNTASPAFYAEPTARRLGFDHCVATAVVVPGRMPLIAAIDGPNNKRAAKIDAMRARDILPPDLALPDPRSWAYTDSAVDIPLLGCAGHGVLVHPRPDLAAQAAAHGWTIVRPVPAVPRGRWLAAAVRMLFGCWRP